MNSKEEFSLSKFLKLCSLGSMLSYLSKLYPTKEVESAKKIVTSLKEEIEEDKKRWF